MGLLSFGQADGLALPQKHNTPTEEIWAISPCAAEEARTNETIVHVHNPPTLAFQESLIPPSVCFPLQLFTSPSILATSNPACISGASLVSSSLRHTFPPPRHMLICFSLFHYHYREFFFLTSPSSCSENGGRMRRFNESVLSPSLEGGQRLMCGD